MTATDGVPNWTQFPPELLERIAERTRDDVTTGLTLFSSVCRAWRAAAGDAPRLLLPVPQGGGAEPRAGSEYALVFPLARGWSVVVDVRDTSCRLSHLATGAAAALPSLNAVRANATSRVVRLGYEHFDDARGKGSPPPAADDAAAPETAGAGAGALAPCHRRNFQVKRRFRAAVADRRRRRRSRWKVRMDPKWKKSLWPDLWNPSPNSEQKIQIKYLYYYFYLEKYLQFSDMIRFAVHVPAGAAAASTDGMLIVMYHPLQGHTGLVFCRPGDAAWTKLSNPVAEFVVDDDDSSGCSSPFGFVDFAFFDGKMFALDKNGLTAVFDAATLEVLDLVDIPPETPNISTKVFPYRPDEGNDPNSAAVDDHLISCLHLLALPSRLLLVRIQVRSSEPESFDVFELVVRSSDDDGMAWCKVTDDRHDGVVGGYDLFLDGHHATFGGGGGGRGNRIYYVHDKHGVHSSSSVAYCYSVLEDKLECVYGPPEESDCEYSTRPSWFLP